MCVCVWYGPWPVTWSAATIITPVGWNISPTFERLGNRRLGPDLIRKVQLSSRLEENLCRFRRVISWGSSSSRGRLVTTSWVHFRGDFYQKKNKMWLFKVKLPLWNKGFQWSHSSLMAQIHVWWTQIGKWGIVLMNSWFSGMLGVL